MYKLYTYFLPYVILFSSVGLETVRALVLLRTVTLKFSPVSLESSYPEWFHSPLICKTLYLYAMYGLHFGYLLLATWSQQKYAEVFRF